MANFFCTSIGKKIIMSVTGLFLVLFLMLHLSLNLLTVIDSSGDLFNIVCKFMAENPLIYIMQYVLAAGFIIHIIYGSWLTWQNQKKRPVSYAVSTKTDVTWSSQNMWITGALILGLLVLHLYNYFYKIKFTDLIDSGQMTEFDLVKSLFTVSNWPFSMLYVLWFIILGLHLNHSFQSGFQTLGLNNQNWIKRLKWIGSIFAIIVAVGFSSITIFFFLQSWINS